MATIDVTRAHTLVKDEAKKRAEQLANRMQQKLGIEWHWDADAIKFEAPRGGARGTKGQVEVHDHDVHVAIDLPFLLRVMKGSIESSVETEMDRALA